MKTFQNLLIVQANVSSTSGSKSDTLRPRPQFKSPMYVHQINPTLEIEAYFFSNTHRSI